MRHQNLWLLAACAVALVGCEANKRPAPPPPAQAAVAPAAGWPDSITLATLRNLGDLPPAKDSVVIGVEIDGRLTVDGEEHSMESLGAVLEERAKATRDGSGPSELNAVVALDEGLPWEVGQWTLQTCAVAHIHRIFFAARTQGDEVLGGFATFLPLDRSLAPPPPPILDRPSATVRVRAGDEHARDPMRLMIPVGGLVAKHGELDVTVDARGDVPMGGVLTVFDVLYQSGAKRMSMVGTPMPHGRTIRDVVEEAAGRSRSWGVELVAHELSALAPNPPPGQRTSGYVGFTDTRAFATAEDFRELEEPVPDSPIEDHEGR